MHTVTHTGNGSATAPSAGLHHITAMCGAARRNLAFYTQTLGLRLIKKTVNFDDPTTYHLYYGDASGSPGTVLTFFPWEHAAPGRRGGAEASETTYAIPSGTLPAWQQRLQKHEVPAREIVTELGERVLAFTDPDGMSNQLVEVPSESQAGGEDSILGFYGVTLWSARPSLTERTLQCMGYSLMQEEGDVRRWQVPGAGIGKHIDVRDGAKLGRGSFGAGSIHHIAFRAADDAHQAELARILTESGLHVTEQRDRQYFRSIYFREPGGVLFEIATDKPGFAVDEPMASLGEALKLPVWLESRREMIESKLPSLTG